MQVKKRGEKTDSLWQMDNLRGRICDGGKLLLSRRLQLREADVKPLWGFARVQVRAEPNGDPRASQASPIVPILREVHPRSSSHDDCTACSDASFHVSKAAAQENAFEVE